MNAPLHFTLSDSNDGSQADRNLIPLSKLKSGQSAVVRGLEGHPHDVARLSEMGFRRGVEFKALRNGTTAILKINFQTLCLRLNKDMVVRVQPLES
jgi:Fe2+ transport system protein FeoA